MEYLKNHPQQPALKPLSLVTLAAIVKKLIPHKTPHELPITRAEFHHELTAPISGSYSLLQALTG